MTGEVRGVTGEVRGVTGEVRSMTGEVRGMTGEVRSMTGEVRGVTGQFALTGPGVISTMRALGSGLPVSRHGVLQCSLAG